MGRQAKLLKRLLRREVAVELLGGEELRLTKPPVDDILPLQKRVVDSASDMTPLTLAAECLVICLPGEDLDAKDAERLILEQGGTVGALYEAALDACCFRPLRESISGGDGDVDAGDASHPLS